MHPHPAGFHDPKLVPEGTRLEHGEEIPQAVQQRLKAGAGGQLKNYEAVGNFRRKPHDLPEIMVKSNQRTTLGAADLEYRLVVRSLQALVANRDDIVARPTGAALFPACRCSRRA